MICRHCGNKLTHTFVDLGSSPPSNGYLTKENLKNSEKWYPLKVMVCDQCWLVQTEDFVDAGEMFSDDYAYFSSYSSTWLEHANKYVEMIISRFNLGENSTVVEVAANDGYLLQYFLNKGVNCYGIEPTTSTAQSARAKGIEILEVFFGEKISKELVQKERQADLMVANNVLAHVPDINDFVRGFAALLKPNGVATFEFPHLLNLVQQSQFDTIYHEHYSYLSLTAIHGIFSSNGLTVFDVEELPTHGGSLRVYSQRSDKGQHSVSPTVHALLKKESTAGIKDIKFYNKFQQITENIKISFLSFLLATKQKKMSIAAYGAAAKGNTLLNFAGVRPDLLSFVVDRNPAKQGKYMPGSRIPIVHEDQLMKSKPDYVVILPWNLKEEIFTQLDYIRDWGGKFVIAVPELTII